MTCRAKMFRIKFYSTFLGVYMQKANYSIKIGDKPLGKIFFNEKTQYFMQKLNTVDLEKVFAFKGYGKKASSPQYEFMTKEQIENKISFYSKKANILLQLPPILDVTEDKVEILSDDVSLDGHDVHHAKFLFTDTSKNVKPQERLVVVREANGRLRTANKYERHRMNQIYFPIEGREIHTPKMFEKEQLKDILDRRDYLFLLDRVCLQFEPDDQEYHDVLSMTFDRIYENADFEKLNSTRHFGTMAFYLSATSKIDKLLDYFLQSEKLIEASFLVRLYYFLHLQEDKFSNVDEPESLDLELAHKIVEEFVTDKSCGALHLQPILNNCTNSIKQRKSAYQDLLQAHGL